MLDKSFNYTLDTNTYMHVCVWVFWAVFVCFSEEIACTCVCACVYEVSECLYPLKRIGRCQNKECFSRNRLPVLSFPLFLSFNRIPRCYVEAKLPLTKCIKRQSYGFCLGLNGLDISIIKLRRGLSAEFLSAVVACQIGRAHV